jgi:hypothetical protein
VQASVPDPSSKASSWPALQKPTTYESRKLSQANPKTHNHSKIRQSSASNCQSKVVFSGRAAENDGALTSYDVLCDGKPQIAIFIPDDTTKPYEAWLDRSEDGKVDMVVFAEGRNEKLSYSLIDSKFSGSFDLMGIHGDGTLKPTSFKQYPS